MAHVVSANLTVDLHKEPKAVKRKHMIHLPFEGSVLGVSAAGLQAFTVNSLY